MQPLFEAVALIDTGLDDVYVGDPARTDHSWSPMGSFVRDDVVVLDGTAAPRVHPLAFEVLAIQRCQGHDPAGTLAGTVRRAAAARCQ
jgi:hypothetical protein